VCAVLDDDSFLFKLSKKTLCTPTSIQDIGLKLLKFKDTLSRCQNNDKATTMNNIYVEWHKQMREQRKTPDEMVELLRCALSETRNVRALKFLNISLDPSSESQQETRKCVNGSVIFLWWKLHSVSVIYVVITEFVTIAPCILPT
jgi:hypothetical protein